MKKISKRERIKRMSNDEELIFGADEEPVNNETETSSVEDAAASDKASAEAEETKAEEAKAEEAEAEEAEAKEAEADEDDEDDELPADNAEAVSDLEARYMSLYAEYDNYRKRTQKEKENLYADAIASVTKEFLTLIDNLDRATEGAKKSDENSLEKVIQGMELVGRQAQDTLKKIGVEEIPAERGTKFDPNLHDAMMHVDDEELGEQEIAMVFAKGYKYKDRVIRHAQVQVAN
ncbi:MAG: nucleotide exchange factor GrpE [Clostridiales bacterium]|nr:nucleotide exchange factor GrpE [Clostridiales bacterium]